MKFLLSRLRPGSISATARCFVYLLASKPYGTLYVGVTSELARRVWEHKIKAVPGFTARDKFNLSEHNNPHWSDLYPNLTGL
jgi:predicted GIY-YIG superfamily endonuclease